MKCSPCAKCCGSRVIQRKQLWLATGRTMWRSNTSLPILKPLSAGLATMLQTGLRAIRFATITVGAFIEMYPEFLEQLKRFAKSENRWVKRAAAVTLIIPARRGKFLKDIFEIADILLEDEDDLVRKGYGWMLKAASEAHQQEVFEYVMKHKSIMPRTSLRYAIEKMPKELKAEAMKK